MNHLFHIPSWGIFLLVVTSGLECFMEMQTKRDQRKVLGMSLIVWTWVLVGVVSIFFIHLRRIKRMLTPPPAALLWHLEHEEGDVPDKHLLPPYRLVPYLKEAPRKTKFFYWWYGTFSPNQQEQLFFRWRNGPSAIIQILQVCLFVLAIFFTSVLRHCLYINQFSEFIWYPLLSLLGVLITILWLFPECCLDLVICSSTGLLWNNKAICAVIKQQDTENQQLMISQLASI